MAARRNRPKVNLKCVADCYTNGPERIVEISSAHGGCLISLRETPDGKLSIHVYAADPTVEVSSSEPEMRTRT